MAWYLPATGGPMVSMIRARSRDETVADERIVKRGIPFFDTAYPGWRRILYFSPVEIAHPNRCPLSILETVSRIAHQENFTLRNLNDERIKSLVRMKNTISYKRALQARGMSLADGVACGLARADDDPKTFYATLRDRWKLHYSPDNWMF